MKTGVGGAAVTLVTTEAGIVTSTWHIRGQTSTFGEEDIR